MDKVLVINLTTITQHVGVIHEDGRKDDVQIVPRRRVELRPGMIVDPAWLGRNPGIVRVVMPVVTSPTVVTGRSSGPARDRQGSGDGNTCAGASARVCLRRRERAMDRV